MRKPSVYLDTSIVSAFWYEGADVSLLARRLWTREWWDLERQHFVVWTSAFTEAELQAGTFAKQAECVKMVRRIRYLVASTEVRDLIQEILVQRLVPANKATDATHLALCAAHGMDYLLTWNYAHMANPIVQGQFDKLCSAVQLISPLMVSPESIPQVRLGQSISRRK
jgi:hypothetical protein